MKELTNKELMFLDALTSENLNINRKFIKLTGSITYGFLLTQLLFLFRSFKYQSFYRSDKEMSDSYDFSEWELRRGREKLTELGFITTKKTRQGKLFYYINVMTIYESYEKTLVNSEETTELNLIPRKPRNAFRGNHGMHSEETTECTINNELDNNNNNEVVVVDKIVDNKRIDEMISFGLTAYQAKELSSAYTEGAVLEKIKICKECCGDIRSPYGAVKKALREDWKAPTKQNHCQQPKSAAFERNDASFRVADDIIKLASRTEEEKRVSIEHLNKVKMCFKKIN